ncbi:MAG: fructosamine kinase family protein [Balneolales bacterium]
MLNESLHKYFRSTYKSEINNTSPVSGGSINNAAKVKLKNGEAYFVKWNKESLVHMFETEAKGLELLKKAKTDLVFPKVEDYNVIPEENISFLVMEYLEPKTPVNSFYENFGKQLAQLHENKSDTYGLDHDNFIGRLPQDNSPSVDWISFFIERRLRPQFEMAVDSAQLPATLIQNFERLCELLPDMLPDEKPSLLHGDLWGGNYLCVSDKQAALVDPAVYYGNREIELSFTQLFGGFDDSFYDAYNEAMPLQSNFNERVDIYNLYPLLVHVNMFGRAYASQVQAIIQDF